MVAQWPGQCSVKLTFCYFSLRGRKGAMTNDDDSGGGGGGGGGAHCTM